jgi:hypothetical protein
MDRKMGARKRNGSSKEPKFVITLAFSSLLTNLSCMADQTENDIEF